MTTTRIDASDAAYAITAVEMTWEEYNALTEDDMAELIGFYRLYLRELALP